MEMFKATNCRKATNGSRAGARPPGTTLVAALHGNAKDSQELSDRKDGKKKSDKRALLDRAIKPSEPHAERTRRISQVVLNPLTWPGRSVRSPVSEGSAHSHNAI